VKLIHSLLVTCELDPHAASGLPRGKPVASGAVALLPLPACGKGVGVRGPLHSLRLDKLRLAETPPNLEFARRARKF
jgi:hypothetical protein